MRWMLVFLAACGGGPGSIEGLPPELDFEVADSVLIDNPESKPYVVLLDQRTECVGEEFPSVLGSRWIVVLIPTPRNQYEWDGPAESRVSVWEFRQGRIFAHATEEGEIVVDTYAPSERASGRFEAVLDGQLLEGSFSARWCCQGSDCSP